jgi:cbb3-type cytochrome oxidase cytochrome c subunit
MKKLIIIINIILLSSLFIACKQNRPEPVVEKYFVSFYNEDFEEIKNYVLEEHRPYYDWLKKLAIKNETASDKQIQVKDIDCEITGDTIANCSCMVVESSKKEPGKQNIQLKKVNNKWLVDQGKEAMAPSEGSDSQSQNEQIPDVQEDMEEVIVVEE